LSDYLERLDGPNSNNLLEEREAEFEGFVPLDVKVGFSDQGNFTTLPSVFHHKHPITVTIGDQNGTIHRIDANEAATDTVREHANRTGAVCQDWFVGSYDLGTGELADYRDNGVSWVIEEFFMTNWWEGYVWDVSTGIPTGRNTSFVPSNESTYPFLCGLPPSVWDDTIGDIIAAGGIDDDYSGFYYSEKIIAPVALIAWVSVNIYDTEGILDDDYYFGDRDAPNFRFGADMELYETSFRRLQEAASSASATHKETTDNDDDPSVDLQVQRLLANRDPLTGEPFMTADDTASHLDEKQREQARRPHMFHGRSLMEPWKLENG